MRLELEAQRVMRVHRTQRRMAEREKPAALASHGGVQVGHGQLARTEDERGVAEGVTWGLGLGFGLGLTRTRTLTLTTGGGGAG